MNINIKRTLSTLSLLFLTLASPLFGQKDSFTYEGKIIFISNKLIEHYSQEDLQNMKKNSKIDLLYQNYLVENSFIIKDFTGKNIKTLYPNLNTLEKLKGSLAPSFDKENLKSFNILAYALYPKQESQIYFTGKDNLAIVIFSKANFSKKFKQYKADLLK
jgi:hypothetical protein